MVNFLKEIELCKDPIEHFSPPPRARTHTNTHTHRHNSSISSSAICEESRGKKAADFRVLNKSDFHDFIPCRSFEPNKVKANVIKVLFPYSFLYFIYIYIFLRFFFLFSFIFLFFHSCATRFVTFAELRALLKSASKLKARKSRGQ